MMHLLGATYPSFPLTLLAQRTTAQLPLTTVTPTLCVYYFSVKNILAHRSSLLRILSGNSVCLPPSSHSLNISCISSLIVLCADASNRSGSLPLTTFTVLRLR